MQHSPLTPGGDYFAAAGRKPRRGTWWFQGVPLVYRRPMNHSPTKGGSFAELFKARVKELGDWRGETLARLRKVIKDADPEVVEEWKWNIPVWKHNGMLCTGETYKAAVKTTFAYGASLKDPMKLFNSSLKGGTRRAIDFHEGEEIDEKALKALIREAVALNLSSEAE
jgi:hypothetical protein